MHCALVIMHYAIEIMYIVIMRDGNMIKSQLSYWIIVVWYVNDGFVRHALSSEHFTQKHEVSMKQSK